MNAHPMHALALGGVVYAITRDVKSSVVVGGAALAWMTTYGHTLGPLAKQDEHPEYISCHMSKDAPSYQDKDD